MGGPEAIGERREAMSGREAKGERREAMSGPKAERLGCSFPLVSGLILSTCRSGSCGKVGNAGGCEEGVFHVSTAQ
jgi:hypothetical protein